MYFAVLLKMIDTLECH